MNALHRIKPLCSESTLLVGNKKDLKHFRKVQKSEAKSLALNFGMRCIECSAAEDYDEIHGSFTRLFFSYLLSLKNTPDASEEETRTSKSSRSQIVPTNSCDQNTKKENVAKQSETKNCPHKVSLRRKISGIGSRLVGTQSTK